MFPVFIEPDWVLSRKVQDNDDLLHEMVLKLSPATKEVPAGRLLHALLQREKQCPTVVNELLAVPHAKLPGLSAFYVALARCKDGIEFAPGKKVKMVFLLLGPDKAQKQYLDLLASVLRLVQEKGQKLLKADPERVAKMLRDSWI